MKETSADSTDDVSESSLAGSYFPLQWAYDFFDVLATHRHTVEVLTYDDLDWGGDYAAGDRYPIELAAWRQSLKEGSRDPNKIYVLIQHDVDRLPERTLRLMEYEALRGLRSNAMVFNQRVNRKHMQETGNLTFTDYDLDVDRLQQLQNEHGFVIGYHCNAYEQAEFDIAKAMRIFEKDVAALRERFRIRYFSAHGGVRDPQGTSNSAVSWLPAALANNIRWVHNGAGVKFDGVFSDGGPNNAKRDPRRRDIRDFVKSWKPGKRYFVLLHPQYYSDPCMPSDRMLEAQWYRDMVEAYRSVAKPHAWASASAMLSSLASPARRGLWQRLVRTFRRW
jgi:hypothetical protein